MHGFMKMFSFWRTFYEVRTQCQEESMIGSKSSTYNTNEYILLAVMNNKHYNLKVVVFVTFGSYPEAFNVSTNSSNSRAAERLCE